MSGRSFLLLLGLFGCESHPRPRSEHHDEYTVVALNDHERAYQAARAAACTQPAYPLVGLGLRWGMNSTQVRQHLDSLRQHPHRSWPLPTCRLGREVWPAYQQGRLVSFFLTPGSTGSPTTTTRDYLDLVRGLEHLYGLSYPHGEAPVVWSWFKGGTEVQLISLNGYGYYLDYLDLPHQPPVDNDPNAHYTL